MQKRGFTLIELLVVVAIIALLIAILIPSLSRARDNARASACLANLKGLGFAFNMYATDHDQYLPPVQNGAPKSTTVPIDAGIPGNPISGTDSYTVNWFGGQGSTSYSSQYGLLIDYWGKANIGGCPSISESDFPNISTGYRVYYGPVDYAYNTILGGQTQGLDGETRQRKLTEVQSQSQKAVVWDSARLVQGTYIFSRTPWGYPCDRVITPGEVDPNFHGRHIGYGNVAWLDGHADKFKPYILNDLSPLGSTTFTGTAPSAQGPQDLTYKIGFIYDGPNPPTFSSPPPSYVDMYYDPSL